MTVRRRPATSSPARGRPRNIDPVGSRLAADGPLRGRLDAALGRLAHDRAAQRLPLPDVAVVRTDDRGVALRLAAPAPLPPAPWVVGADRLAWTLRFADLIGESGELGGPTTAPPHYPALVEVGHDESGHVLVDLAYASGVVALTGPGAAAAFRAVVGDLHEQPWSGGVQVTLVSPAGASAPPVLPGGPPVVSLPEALAAGDLSVLAAQLREQLHAEGVLHGRSGARTRQGLRVLALVAPPDLAEVARLTAILRGRRHGVAALCVGDAPGVRWRVVVDESGSVDLGVLTGPRRPVRAGRDERDRRTPSRPRTGRGRP